MQLHTDLRERVVVDTHALEWTPSPIAGVERRMLERAGEETGRATSIVRYAPGSRFPVHTHDGGEELFVLAGTLSDEHGSYGPGTYLRSPPGSAHAPYSEGGCTLLVKLCQIPAHERERVATTGDDGWQGAADELQRLPLFHDEATGERVYVVRFPPGCAVDNDEHPGGEELLVLEGELVDEHGRYPAGTWVRQPHGSRHSPRSESGCTLLVKRGHMPRT